MSREGKRNVAALITVAVTLAGSVVGVSSYISRNEAQAAVRDVREDVAALKQARVYADDRLTRIEQKVDVLLDRTARLDKERP